MAESKRGHNLVNISWNSLKSLLIHGHNDPKPYTKYHHPSSCGSQDIMLTMFFNCYNGRVEKET